MHTREVFLRNGDYFDSPIMLPVLHRFTRGLLPDASAGAALVMAKLRGLFVLAEASRRRERVAQARGKLEAFLGV